MKMNNIEKKQKIPDNVPAQYQKISFRQKRYFSSLNLSPGQRENELFIIKKEFKQYIPNGKCRSIFECNNIIKEESDKGIAVGFSMGVKKDKKLIKSTEEIILEESRKFQFKALPINKSLFNHIKKKFTTKEEILRSNRKKTEKKVIKSKSFTANPIPPFTVMEVKKSDKMLTLAKSPFLLTKQRSLQRINREANKINAFIPS